MARNKTLVRKKKLAREGKLSKPVPVWVTAKTRIGGKRLRRHNRRRTWKTSRIKP
ncbi:MAG TPA: hypothetical protein VKU94_00420 [Geobacterales bacterium]|nr:hypothetical protein [Geobacterales bacterium]